MDKHKALNRGNWTLYICILHTVDTEQYTDSDTVTNTSLTMTLHGNQSVLNYCIYRGPVILDVFDLAPLPRRPPPSRQQVVYLSLSPRVSQVELNDRRGRGWGGVKFYNRKKASSSMNHSILFDGDGNWGDRDTIKTYEALCEFFFCTCCSMLFII